MLLISFNTQENPTTKNYVVLKGSSSEDEEPCCTWSRVPREAPCAHSPHLTAITSLIIQLYKIRVCLL